MKIQALYDLQQEINRLYIAGSKFAKNDPRITKHIPVLSKLGEKAPVFKKLAQDVEVLTQCEATESSEKLLEIGTLLYSILYTQGETTDEQPLSELNPVFDLENAHTTASYLELKPAIDALSISSQGRYGVVEEAFKQGVFDDFRTFEYLNKALGDKYSELADLVEEKIVPSIGEKIIPFIQKDFNYEGKSDDIRRFRILSKFEPDDAVEEMSLRILETSSPPMQAEATLILGHNPKHEKLIISLADDKQKAVREAAYISLARYATKESLDKLKDVFVKNKNKSNLPGIATALITSKLPFFFQEVFDQVYQSFQNLISLEKSTEDKVLLAAFEEFVTKLGILKNKDREEVYTFFKEVFSNKEYNELINSKKSLLVYQATELTNSIAFNLYQLDQPVATEVLKYLSETPYHAKEWNKDFISFYFIAISKTFSKEQMFDTFSEHYQKGNISSHLFFETYTERFPDKRYRRPSGGYYSTFQFGYIEHVDNLDKRWSPLFIENVRKGWKNEHALESFHLVSLFEGIQSKCSRDLLTELAKGLLDSKNQGYLRTQLSYIAEKLLASGTPNTFDLIFSVMESYPKNNQYPNYYISQLADEDFIKKFPVEYAEKFSKLGEKTKLDGFLEIAEKIKIAKQD